MSQLFYFVKMKPIDKFRCSVMEHISQVDSFHNSWNTFQKKIDSIIGVNPNATQIFTLGEHLSEIFTSNSSSSARDQSDVSGGGAAWECLSTWYFNLIFWGTNVIATKQNKKFVPEVLYDAFCVSISNHQTNTESDITIYSIPDTENLVSIDLNIINELIISNIQSVDTSIVQCKTNWNDNSQIPMLWDLIYNSNSFRIPNVSVGTNGVSPSSFRRFSYSFLTVPSNKKVNYKSSSVSVLRVKNLTGGNYWGKPSQDGVCNSLNNFFGRNFVNHFEGSISTHITNQLKIDPKYYIRFRELSF